MACKIFVNHPGSLDKEAEKSKRQTIADHLHVLPEDVIIMPGVTLSVVEVPDEMVKERDKADKHAAAEAEKRRKEEEETAAKQAKAEAKAAAARAKEEAAHPHAAERAANPPEGMGLPKLSESGVPETQPAKHSPAKKSKR